jgi:hypothetical protein
MEQEVCVSVATFIKFRGPSRCGGIVTAQPLALHAVACALCTSLCHRYTLARVVAELTLSSRLVHILTVAKLPLRRMQWWSGTRECFLRIVWVSRCSILVQNKYTGSTVGQQIHSRSKGAANFVLFRKLWFLCFFAHVARLRELCGVRLAGILISQQQIAHDNRTPEMKA